MAFSLVHPSNLSSGFRWNIKRPYVCDVGGGSLKFVAYFQILLFLNNRSIVHCGGWWGWRWGQKIGHFCERHKWMTPYMKKRHAEL